jgi:predicted dehydrogenase
MVNVIHCPSLRSLEDVQIAAICDLDAGRLNATADKFGIERRYADYRRMIEDTAPDAVYVIGPPDVMYPHWVWCLEHGLNLFIEKPMGLTMHQARMLAYLAEKNDCITQVGFQRRACPLAVALRNECLKRGAITHAMCRFYKNIARPLLDARDHMMDEGVHCIDTLRWICGGEVKAIHSVATRVRMPDINLVLAILEFDSGAVGVLSGNWYSGRRIFDIDMHAPGICAEADLEGKGYLYADNDTQGIEFDTRTVAGSDELYVHGGFRAKHREFIDCLKSGKQPGSGFADAVKTMDVAERILAASLLEGR